MIFCTICAANHLPQAACLAKSLADAHPRDRLILCLLERDRSALPPFQSCFSEVVLGSDFGIADFEPFMFRHSAYEACAAVKGSFLLWAMQRFPDEQMFVYLDTDIFVYSRLEELEALLPSSEIIMTPHLLHDEPTIDGVRDNTFRILIAGAFNLGFLAVRRSASALNFLSWWNRKLQNFCYMEWQRGLFGDQKWALLGLSFFDVTVLREPNYNVANWNISTRRMSPCAAPPGVLVDGKPLRFFHFADLKVSRDMYYLKKYLPADSPVFSLREQYIRRIQAFDPGGYAGRPWSYGAFHSGEPISADVRSLYRNNAALAAAIGNPFTSSTIELYSVLGRISQQSRGAAIP